MNTSIEPKTGSLGDLFRRISLGQLDETSPGWMLLVGPRSLNASMLAAIARLGESGPLRVLDGGNRFNAYTVARAARGRQDILDRITVARAFTCYQVLSLLEGTPAIQIPFVILDFLSTFYDESVQVGERKRLLRACTMHLERLVGAAGGSSTTHVVEAADGGWSRGDASQRPPRLVVSVHPPAVPSQAAVELLGLLQASTREAYFIQPAAPAPEPLRLF